MFKQINTVFYDGITSEEKPVQVIFYNNSLEIIITESGKHESWSYDEIEIEQRPTEGRKGVVSNSMNRDARLFLEAEDYKFVARKIPKLKSEFFGLGLKMLAGILLILGLVFYAIPALAPHILPHIPKSWDKKLGDYASRYIVDKPKLCKNLAGTAALKKVARDISKGVPDLDLQISIQRSDTVNALALPGGRILIFSELLKQADTQEEFIGVLAHEAAHVHFRHGTENITRYLLSSFVIDIFTGGAGTLAYMGMQLNDVQYSQELEAAADEWAVTRLHKMQVEPTKLANFFLRAKTEKKNSAEDDSESFFSLGDFEEYLSTHPADKARIDKIESRAATLQAQAPVAEFKPLLSDKEWRALKQICN